MAGWCAEGLPVLKTRFEPRSSTACNEDNAGSVEGCPILRFDLAALIRATDACILLILALPAHFLRRSSENNCGSECRHMVHEGFLQPKISGIHVT